MDFLFVMDPIESLHVYQDTTLVMMLEAERRGHGVYYARLQDLSLRGAEAYANAWPATVRREEGRHYTLGTRAQRPLAAFDVIAMRKDPPVDAAFVTATLLLDAAPPSTLVVNRPEALRSCNEKLFAMRFPELTLPSLVSQDASEILQFCDAVGGEAVLKPIDGRGGEGVFFLGREDRNHRVVVETVTDWGRRPALVQRFLRDVGTVGDKRVIVIQGEPLGAVLRLPQRGDFRSNVHVGGRVTRAEVDERDREIARVIGPELRRRGILFAGIDVIGGYLTEINITSPTLVQEIAELTGVHLEERILDAIEQEYAARRSA